MCVLNMLFLQVVNYLRRKSRLLQQHYNTFLGCGNNKCFISIFGPLKLLIEHATMKPCTLVEQFIFMNNTHLINK